MSVDRSFVARNDAERARLHTLVARLSDAELERPLANGWTVVAVLAHLAFWDRRALLLVERWERTGAQETPEDPETVNNAALPQWLALPPRVAAEQAIQAADAIDAKLASLGDMMLESLLRLRSGINLNRGDAHRSEHLDEILQSVR